MATRTAHWEVSYPKMGLFCGRHKQSGSVQVLDEKTVPLNQNRIYMASNYCSSMSSLTRGCVRIINQNRNVPFQVPGLFHPQGPSLAIGQPLMHRWGHETHENSELYSKTGGQIRNLGDVKNTPT